MGFINDILISVTSSVEVSTTTYTLTDADNNNTLVFTNSEGCVIEPYSGTPPNNFNVRIVSLGLNQVQLNFFTRTSDGEGGYFETNDSDIFLEYFSNTLGWKISGLFSPWSAGLGAELALPFVSAGTGYNVFNADPPNKEVTFSDGNVRFVDDDGSTFMQFRLFNVLTIGNNYRMTTIVSSQDGSSDLQNNGSVGEQLVTNGVNSPYTHEFEASKVHIELLANDDDVDITLSYISIREIL